jgi:hypothetical protein
MSLGRAAIQSICIMRQLLIYPMINTARRVALLGIIFTVSVHYSLSARAEDNNQQNLTNDDGKSQTKVPLEKKEESADAT